MQATDDGEQIIGRRREGHIWIPSHQGFDLSGLGLDGPKPFGNQQFSSLAHYLT